jgi:ribosomal-protein-alanine acetyltransferase
VYTIRKFKPTDMFAVIKLASETLTEQYNPSLFNYFYENYPKGFIITEIRHKIIGFIIGIKLNNEIAKILMLSIAKPYRRKKIGSQLLNQFLKNIKSENITNIELEVRIDNKKAIQFYQKHGFEIVKKITHFYQDGKSAFTMKKII